MAITPLPPAPEPTDSTAEFNTKAFAWVASLDNFTTEANALATGADTDASTATTQAGIATTQAGISTTQAGIATTQAGISTTQAGIATTKAGEALASANAAAASYDQFDDRYLGSKTSDPSLDNDGNSLLNGALYFNSVANEMRVYNGSSWQSPAVVGGTVANLNVTGVLDTTNIEVTNLKAKDGTAAGSIADSTGVVTLASSVLTTTDINGGTIDGTTIGGSTAAAGTFTNLAYTGTLTGGTGIINIGSGQVYKDASGNVGIGTSSAGVKLDTVGVVRSTFNSVSNAGSGSHGLELRQSTTSTKALIAGYSTSGNQTGAYIQAVNFGTAYEDLVIQPQGGNLGLGVTPSAWSGSGSVFQVGSGGGFLRGDNNTVAVGNNFYYNGSNAIYLANGHATRYEQYINTGIHAWFNAPSGTAGNAISFTQAMTLDASGKLLVGTTTAVNDANLPVQLNAASGSAKFFAVNRGDAYGVVFGYDYSADLAVISNIVNTPLAFKTNNTERMRIDSSGNLLVNTTTIASQGQMTLNFNGGGNQGINIKETANSAAAGFMYFQHDTTVLGTITRNGATNAVLYNTTSDVRLKENITEAQPALATVSAIKVRQYDWIGTDYHQNYGFIAQELAEVVSDVVTKGRTEEDTWAVDYGKLTPILVKAIQEQQAIITQLQADVAALKGN